MSGWLGQTAAVVTNYQVLLMLGAEAIGAVFFFAMGTLWQETSTWRRPK